jgi:sugar lactone lactonase YvrE
VAVTQGHVLVVVCDSKGSDHLLQIPSEGGATETVAELPRASHELCRYASVVADEYAVFIADWNGSRVLAVSRADKSVTPIVTKQGFPASLSLDSTGLSFTSALGVFHVDRQGGTLTQLVKEDVALAPYALTATYGDEH